MKTRELPFVREMFDAIAPRYDLLNRLLSLRQDVIWRKRLVDAMPLPAGGHALDVACGTGDVMLAIRQRKGGAVRVTGVDFSPGMLALARQKIAPLADPGLALVAADALALPFQPESFEGVTIAFGIRNIQDKAGALAAFRRVLKPGGRVLILELATPQHPRLRQAYLAYFQRVLPLIGRLFSRHHYAYRYLPDSVARFPSNADFMQLMQKAGFGQVSCRRLTLGIANLFVGVR